MPLRHDAQILTRLVLVQMDLGGISSWLHPSDDWGCTAQRTTCRLSASAGSRWVPILGAHSTEHPALAEEHKGEDCRVNVAHRT